MLRPVSQSTGISTRTHLFGRVWDAAMIASIEMSRYLLHPPQRSRPRPSRGSYVSGEQLKYVADVGFCEELKRRATYLGSESCCVSTIT